jgi:hypothetical protein
MSITTDEWVEILRREYLQGFIRQGGAAVKFCVRADGSHFEFAQSTLPAAARDEGYMYAFVDAAHTKIHQIDKVFFDIAKQIDWDSLAETYVRKYFIRHGYRIPETGGDYSIHSIALINNCEEMQFRNDTKSGIQRELFNDYDMSQEFRFAMTRLCINQFDTDGPEDYLSDSVKEWLRGELRMITSLKDALIFQRITKYNARHILYSLAHWIKVNDRNGLVLLLDITGCFASKNQFAQPNAMSYTTPMVLDTYEVLRQFIDGTSDMESLMMVVTAPPEFLTDERRGLNKYDALKMRIWNEVRDRQRQNPLSSLIRLSTVKQ